MAWYLRKNGSNVGWSLDTAKNSSYTYLTKIGSSVGWKSGGSTRNILTKSSGSGNPVGWRSISFPPTKWTYIGTTGTANGTINRGSITSCNTNETASLNYLNSNYPASNHSVGYVVKVVSTSGFFPNEIPCNDRYFRADL